MRLDLRPAVFAALCILSSGLCSAATTLKLKNGSVVIGEVTKQEGGKVYIKADLLGDLVVDESDVASFSTALWKGPSLRMQRSPPNSTTSGFTVPHMPSPLREKQDGRSCREIAFHNPSS